MSSINNSFRFKFNKNIECENEERNLEFENDEFNNNSNMDLILTLARQSCTLNNSLRLIIVSATMDDDEPRYRRYFR